MDQAHLILLAGDAVVLQLGLGGLLDLHGVCPGLAGDSCRLLLGFCFGCQFEVNLLRWTQLWLRRVVHWLKALGGFEVEFGPWFCGVGVSTRWFWRWCCAALHEVARLVNLLRWMQGVECTALGLECAVSLGLGYIAFPRLRLWLTHGFIHGLRWPIVVGAIVRPRGWPVIVLVPIATAGKGTVASHCRW